MGMVFFAEKIELGVVGYPDATAAVFSQLMGSEFLRNYGHSNISALHRSGIYKISTHQPAYAAGSTNPVPTAGSNDILRREFDVYKPDIESTGIDKEIMSNKSEISFPEGKSDIMKPVIKLNWFKNSQPVVPDIPTTQAIIQTPSMTPNWFNDTKNIPLPTPSTSTTTATTTSTMTSTMTSIMTSTSTSIMTSTSTSTSTSTITTTATITQHISDRIIICENSSMQMKCTTVSSDMQLTPPLPQTTFLTITTTAIIAGPTITQNPAQPPTPYPIPTPSTTFADVSNIKTLHKDIYIIISLTSFVIFGGLSTNLFKIYRYNLKREKRLKDLEKSQKRHMNDIGESPRTIVKQYENIRKFDTFDNFDDLRATKTI
jgi:hypothetical protein